MLIPPQVMHTECRAPLVGVLAGEGVGPEVIPGALDLLELLSGWSGRRFIIRHGGSIGRTSLKQGKGSLPDDVAAFARDVFAEGGVLFCGPGGDRFVYELRAMFDLYCKFTPLQPLPALNKLGPLQAERISGVDIVAVRENVGGVYQGSWSTDGKPGKRVAHHEFHYREQEVSRILQVALALAGTRRKQLCVVVKEAGVPSVSALWIELAGELVKNTDTVLTVLDVDNAVYQMIADPARFDVIVSPNMFGDVIADAGALLLGSRGLSYSGNFGPDARAAYQTGHGAAWDIAGKNVANPLGQMRSLALMLEHSFGWPSGATLVRTAIAEALASGARTRDIAQTGCDLLTTAEMAVCVKRKLENLLAATAK